MLVIEKKGNLCYNLFISIDTRCLFKHLFLEQTMLEVNQLRFSYGDKELFNDLEFKIYTGEHVGLVGVNGSGKTTLMNLLAHRLIPDAGDIRWEKAITFSYLDQQLSVEDDVTIYQYLYTVYEELFQKEDEMHALYQSLAHEAEHKYDRIIQKAENIQAYLDEHDFYRVKSKIGNIINGLGIDISENRRLRELSGGQRAKVFLGKMLLEEKEMLMLDEPTNFLDTHHIDWLTKFLINYGHAFLVISHHTDFLNSVCNVILSLENKKITRYKGNYVQYIHQKTMNQATYEKEYQKQQKYIKQTETFIQKNIVRATTTKRAQSRRKSLEKLVVLEKPQVEKRIQFSFPFTKSYSQKSIIVKKLSIGYMFPILENIHLEFDFGQKYVIIGKNGVGKTTLIKTLLYELQPLQGSIHHSPFNDIVYYSQEIEITEDTPIQFVRNDYPLMTDEQIRTLLAQYAITGVLALRSMKQLSGGEVSRVRFAKLSLKRGNVLILDEPTNHLDKTAKIALFEALKDYPGTIILVSHEKLFYKELKMKEIRF